MEIQLSQNKVAVVDEGDADLATPGWRALRRKRTYYAQRNVRKPDGARTTERLHQVIARRMGIVGPPDHKDQNGLNNRRDNLRPADKGQNSANVGRRADNTSGYKGVGWHRPSGKWSARIAVDGKRRHLGRFADPIEAAKAYDRAALVAFGEFAVLNFPGSLKARQ